MTAKTTRRVETIDLPGLGEVQVKSLLLTQYLELSASRRGTSDDKALSDMSDTEFLLHLMTLTVFKKDGKPVYTTADQWDGYLGQNIIASSGLFQLVREVSGLNSSVEEAEKK